MLTVATSATPDHTDTSTRRRRLPHPAWSTRQLAAYLGRGPVAGLTSTAHRLLLVLCCCADDRTGETTMAIDALAERAGLDRSTVYRHLADLETSGLVLYRPGQITRGRGHPSRWRVVKTALASALTLAALAREKAAQARRRATAEVAARLIEVRRTVSQRARDARYKTSQRATHPAPSGADLPAAAPHRPECRGCGRWWRADLAPPDLLCATCRSVSLTGSRP